MNKKSIVAIPPLVYVAVIIAFVLSSIVWLFSPEFSMNLLATDIGAILTVIIIDTLLLRDKRRRWKIVHEEMEYLIARTVYGLRTDILHICFSFTGEFVGDDEKEIETTIARQQDERLEEITNLDDNDLVEALSEHVLAGNLGEYFKNKAEVLRKYLIMRYTDYLPPEVVKELIKLHTALEGLDTDVK